PLMLHQPAAQPRQRQPTEIDAVQIGATQIETLAGAPALLVPRHWAVSLLVRRQQPLHVRPRERHAREGKHPPRQVGYDRAPLGESALALGRNLRLRAPGLAVRAPALMPFPRLAQRRRWWWISSAGRLLAHACSFPYWLAAAGISI